MNKRLFTILAGIFAVMSFAACNDDKGIDPSAAEPTITYAYDTLEADLNVVDNLPVVAIVKSEAGLKSVSLSINTSDGETVPVTTVTEFFNARSYSLAEEINYEPNYTEAVIEAVDLLGRKAEAKMPISIIDVVEAPSIVFTPAKWSYDETVGGEKPRTHIEVNTSALLQSIEITRVKTSGQEPYTSLTFTDEDQQKSWTFDEMIEFDEFDRGFKVKAVDNYGQVRIETMQIQYKTVPPPVVTFAQTTIAADKDEEKTVEIAIESQAGVVKVELFRVEGKTETSVKATTYERLNELNYAEKMLFTNSTSGVKVIVTDNVGRTTTATTKACVNMYYVEDIPVATAPAGDGAEAAGGAKRLLSLGDQKTYSVQECLENTDLQSHADVKVYYMNGNAQSVRIYSMENADGKNAEYSYNGQNIGSFGGLNATRFKLLTDVDFESATAADIDAIDAGTIQSSNIKGKEELIGAVIAFKTGAKSSAGSGKVGLMKLVAIGEKIGTNANARVFTFAVKLPKE